MCSCMTGTDNRPLLDFELQVVPGGGPSVCYSPATVCRSARLRCSHNFPSPVLNIVPCVDWSRFSPPSGCKVVQLSVNVLQIYARLDFSFIRRLCLGFTYLWTVSEQADFAQMLGC